MTPTTLAQDYATAHAEEDGEWDESVAREQQDRVPTLVRPCDEKEEM